LYFIFIFRNFLSDDIFDLECGLLSPTYILIFIFRHLSKTKPKDIYTISVSHPVQI